MQTNFSLFFIGEENFNFRTVKKRDFAAKCFRNKYANRRFAVEFSNGNDNKYASFVASLWLATEFRKRNLLYFTRS